jgi:hypothetical protein
MRPQQFMRHGRQVLFPGVEGEMPVEKSRLRFLLIRPASPPEVCRIGRAQFVSGSLPRTSPNGFMPFDDRFRESLDILDGMDISAARAPCQSAGPLLCARPSLRLHPTPITLRSIRATRRPN